MNSPTTSSPKATCLQSLSPQLKWRVQGKKKSVTKQGWKWHKKPVITQKSLHKKQTVLQWTWNSETLNWLINGSLTLRIVLVRGPCQKWLSSPAFNPPSAMKHLQMPSFLEVISTEIEHHKWLLLRRKPRNSSILNMFLYGTYYRLNLKNMVEYKYFKKDCLGRRMPKSLTAAGFRNGNPTYRLTPRNLYHE